MHSYRFCRVYIQVCVYIFKKKHASQSSSSSFPIRHFVGFRVIWVGLSGNASGNRILRRVRVTRPRARQIRVRRWHALFTAVLFSRSAEQHGPGRLLLELFDPHSRVTSRSRGCERRRFLAAPRLGPSRDGVHRHGRQVNRPVPDRRGHEIRVRRRRGGKFFLRTPFHSANPHITL